MHGSNELEVNLIVRITYIKATTEGRNEIVNEKWRRSASIWLEVGNLVSLTGNGCCAGLTGGGEARRAADWCPASVLVRPEGSRWKTAATGTHDGHGVAVLGLASDVEMGCCRFG